MLGWKLVEEFVGAGQVMRDYASGPDDLFDAFAGKRRELAILAAGFEDVIASADEGFGQIGGVANDGHDGKVLTVTDEVFGDDGAIATRKAVAADPTFR